MKGIINYYNHKKQKIEIMHYIENIDTALSELKDMQNNGKIID